MMSSVIRTMDSSTDIQPQLSVSHQRRHRLAKIIRENGVEMPTPCKRCTNAHTRSKCIVDLKSGRCAPCVAKGRTCDLVVTRAEFDKLRNTKEKLRRQIESSRKERASLWSKILEVEARNLRLEKQLEKAENQEEDAIEREMASIEELEQAEAQASVSMLSDTVPGPDVLQMSPSDWALIDGVSWDVLDGSVSTVVGNSTSL